MVLQKEVEIVLLEESLRKVLQEGTKIVDLT